MLVSFSQSIKQTWSHLVTCGRSHRKRKGQLARFETSKKKVTGGTKSNSIKVILKKNNNSDLPMDAVTY